MRAYWSALILAAIVVALMLWAIILKLEPRALRLGLARATEPPAATTAPA